MGSSAGAVIHFQRMVGSGWVRLEELYAPPPHSGERFGHSLAWRGETFVSGGYSADAVVIDTGAAFVFDR